MSGRAGWSGDRRATSNIVAELGLQPIQRRLGELGRELLEHDDTLVERHFGYRESARVTTESEIAPTQPFVKHLLDGRRYDISLAVNLTTNPRRITDPTPLVTSVNDSPKQHVSQLQMMRMPVASMFRIMLAVVRGNVIYVSIVSKRHVVSKRSPRVIVFRKHPPNDSVRIQLAMARFAVRDDPTYPHANALPVQVVSGTLEQYPKNSLIVPQVLLLTSVASVQRHVRLLRIEENRELAA